MDISQFFDKINEKTWRNNIKEDASRKLDELIEYLQENRETLIEEVVESMKLIEEVKKEDGEILTASDGERWTLKYVKDSIKGLL
jgi:acyl-CoA reductase-like NAD-dependent aldehyde dehydrogenase